MLGFDDRCAGGRHARPRVDWFSSGSRVVFEWFSARRRLCRGVLGRVDATVVPGGENLLSVCASHWFGPAAAPVSKPSVGCRSAPRAFRCR